MSAATTTKKQFLTCHTLGDSLKYEIKSQFEVEHYAIYHYLRAAPESVERTTTADLHDQAEKSEVFARDTSAEESRHCADTT